MISFITVTKSFGDDIFALKDVSFTIEPGELVVITGPSGSGKTTIMRLLTKEYEPTEGEITFEDLPLAKIKHSKVHELRRKIGVVFQDYKLLPELNVWENIALSLYITGQKQAEIEERVTDLLHLINLEDKPYLFPSQLSGGEAQRVSIARALATAPRVIFADEPTGNLDTQSSTSIARLLQKINQLGTTVLIATHDVGVLDLLQNERHMHLEKGQLVSDEKGTATKKIRKSVAPTSSTIAEVPTSTPDNTPPEKPEAEPLVDTSVESLDEPVSSPAKSRKKLLSMPKISWPFGRKPVATSEVTSEPTTKVESLEEAETDLDLDDEPEEGEEPTEITLPTTPKEPALPKPVKLKVKPAKTPKTTAKTEGAHS